MIGSVSIFGEMTDVNALDGLKFVRIGLYAFDMWQN